jgi:predicted aspartyl protease
VAVRSFTIVSQHFPYLRAEIIVGTLTLDAECYLDTGFDGYLIVPENHTDRLGPGDFVSRWELGDATTVPAEAYLGRVRLAGLDNEIEAVVIALGNEYLMGRSITDRFRVTFDRDQTVEVE